MLNLKTQKGQDRAIELAEAFVDSLNTLGFSLVDAMAIMSTAYMTTVLDLVIACPDEDKARENLAAFLTPIFKELNGTLGKYTDPQNIKIKQDEVKLARMEPASEVVQ